MTHLPGSQLYSPHECNGHSHNSSRNKILHILLVHPYCLPKPSLNIILYSRLPTRYNHGNWVDILLRSTHTNIQVTHLNNKSNQYAQVKFTLKISHKITKLFRPFHKLITHILNNSSLGKIQQPYQQVLPIQVCYSHAILLIQPNSLSPQHISTGSISCLNN